MAAERSAAASPFPNYTQLDPVLPLWAWQGLRFASIAAASPANPVPMTSTS